MNQLRMSKKSKQSSGLTNKQALVMNLLRKTKGPLSAYAILDQLHDSVLGALYRFIVLWKN